MVFKEESFTALEKSSTQDPEKVICCFFKNNTQDSEKWLLANILCVNKPTQKQECGDYSVTFEVHFIDILPNKI